MDEKRERKRKPECLLEKSFEANNKKQVFLILTTSTNSNYDKSFLFSGNVARVQCYSHCYDFMSFNPISGFVKG